MIYYIDYKYFTTNYFYIIRCNLGVKQQSTPPDERELSCIFFGKGQFSNFNPQGQALRVFGGISTPFASLRVVFHQKNLVD